MRRVFQSLATALLCQALATRAAAFDAASALRIAIPEGDVERVEINGTQVWPSAIPYETNGLVAMYDARWNAGIGRHDSTATTWAELASGWDATQRVSTGWAWASDAYVGTTNAGAGLVCPYDITRIFWNCRTNHTVEIVCKSAASQRMDFFGGYGTFAVNFESTAANGFRVYYAGKPDLAVGYTTSRHTWAVAVDGGDFGTRLYRDGVAVRTATQFSGEGWNGTARMILGGENDRATMSLVGELCCVRLYNRTLSAAEIAANSAIDRVRFGF